MIGKARVLGEERAMQIAAIGGLVYGTLRTIFAVVAPADKALAQWSAARAEIRAPGMIFKRHDGAHFRHCALHQHVADIPRMPRVGVRVEQADSGQVVALERAIVMP